MRSQYLNPHQAPGYPWVVLWMGRVETEQVMLTSALRIPVSLSHGGAMDILHICPVLPLIPAPHLPSSQSVCDEEGDRKSGRTVLFLCTCYFRTHRTYALGTASGAVDNL